LRDTDALHFQCITYKTTIWRLFNFKALLLLVYILCIIIATNFIQRRQPVIAIKDRKPAKKSIFPKRKQRSKKAKAERKIEKFTVEFYSRYGALMSELSHE